MESIQIYNRDFKVNDYENTETFRQACGKVPFTLRGVIMYKFTIDEERGIRIFDYLSTNRNVQEIVKNFFEGYYLIEARCNHEFVKKTNFPAEGVVYTFMNTKSGEVPEICSGDDGRRTRHELGL